MVNKIPHCIPTLDDTLKLGGNQVQLLKTWIKVSLLTTFDPFMGFDISLEEGKRD